MSRSYRKKYRSTICSCTCTPRFIKFWKNSYNRNIRRTSKHLINKLDLDSIEDDNTIFPIDPETDVRFGNLWECGDGFEVYADMELAAEHKNRKIWQIVHK